MNFKQAQEAKILKRIPLLISTFQQTKIVGPIRTYLGLSKAWMVYVRLQEGKKLLKSQFCRQYVEPSPNYLCMLIGKDMYYLFTVYFTLLVWSGMIQECPR